MEPRSKHGWPFWIATMVLLPLLYIASFGPACWISSRAGYGISTIQIVYRPLLRAMKADRRVATGIDWYARIGAPDDWYFIDYGDDDWDWAKSRRGHP